MTNVEIAESIRHGLFAERSSLKEAFDYAFEVVGRIPQAEQIAVTTAIFVLTNTIAKELLKQEGK